MRVGAELGLIGVALEQAGRKRVAPLFVEPVRQDLADFSLGMGGGGHAENKQCRGKL